MVTECLLEAERPQLYQLFLDSLLEDVRKVHPNWKQKDLHPGLIYDKTLSGKLGQQAVCRVKVEKLTENEEYQVSFESQRGVTTVSYQLSEQDGMTNVRYEENFVSEQKLQQINYNLMAAFYRRGSRKKVVRMLRSMEAYLKQKKETVCQD